MTGTYTTSLVWLTLLGGVTQPSLGYLTADGLSVCELGLRANVPNVHSHRFRHDTSRRLVEAVDLPTVAPGLGHERLDTVRIWSADSRSAPYWYARSRKRVP